RFLVSAQPLDVYLGGLLSLPCCLGRRALRSFPTRRSSDLELQERLPYRSVWSPDLSALRRRGAAACTRGEAARDAAASAGRRGGDRKSTRLNSSHVKISYAVSCLKKTTPPERSDTGGRAAR